MMMRGKFWGSRAGMLATLGLVTACSTPALVELRNVEPVADPYYTALSMRYLEFAEEEAAQYDWGDSRYFAEKGLRAAYGHDLQPEEPEKWRLPPASREEIEAVRPRLMKALEHQAAKKDYPAMAAEAMFHYDCWVEQQEEAWQTDDIAYCRDTFYAALEGLERVLRQKVGSDFGDAVPVAPESPVSPVSPVVTQPSAEPAPAEEESMVLATSYIVFFDSGQIGLDKDGKKVIGEVLDEVRKFADYTISINGHTDSVGKAAANVVVSRKRANIVKDALVKGGVESRRINVAAFGESVPRVSTPDEVSEKANRRVEIFINQ